MTTRHLISYALAAVCGFVWGGAFESMRSLERILDLYARVVTHTHPVSDTGCLVRQSAVELRPGETVTVCGVTNGVRTSCEVKTCLGDKATEKPAEHHRPGPDSDPYLLQPGPDHRGGAIVLSPEPPDTSPAVLKTTCPICGKTYERVSGYATSCAVAHPPGSCCHYGEREVKP